MMDLFENLNFLEFVKNKLEKEIKYQEALIESEKRGFYDKQLDSELCKELHTLERWHDRIFEYIIDLESVRYADEKKNVEKKENYANYIEQVAKLLSSNKTLIEKNKALVEEIKLLNEEINQRMRKN
jgi:hypothetical protein